METVTGILVALHLIGWAIALGAIVYVMRAPTMPSGVLHGLYLALLTGLALAGIAIAQDWDVSHVKLAIKFTIALAAIGAALWGRRHLKSVSRGYLGGLAGLIVVNVFVAVLW